MVYFNIFLTILSVICTVFSIIGAWKANVYYKKSKQITIYTNANKSYIESKKILSSLTEILKLSNRPSKRGTNCANQIRVHGENIKSSINKIRENMSSKDLGEIQNLLNSDDIKVDRYVDSLIAGIVIIDGKFIINEDFSKCQQKFYDLQIWIKRTLEEAEEKLK